MVILAVSTAIIERASRAEIAERISGLWSRSCESVLALGRALIDAKSTLPHGEFTAMIDVDLPFSPETARRFMRIAEDPRLEKRSLVNVLPASVRALDEIRKLPDGQFGEAIASGDINQKMTVRQARALARKTKDKPVSVAESEIAPGTRIKLGNFENAEQLCREIMRKQKSKSCESVCDDFKIYTGTFRKMRDIVMLADRADLSAADATAVKHALAAMNETRQVTTKSYEAIKHIVLRVWGEKRRRNLDKVEASRIAAFERALSTILQACSGAGEITVPHLGPDRAASAIKELNNAIPGLRELIRKIERIHQ